MKVLYYVADNRVPSYYTIIIKILLASLVETKQTEELFRNSVQLNRFRHSYLPASIPTHTYIYIGIPHQ